MTFFWYLVFGYWVFQKKFFFCFFPIEITLAFIWGIIYSCTMDGFFRILKKTSSELICTRLYLQLDLLLVFSNENNLGLYMRYHFFLPYRWFLQNLGKDFIRTNMHTTVYPLCLPLCINEMTFVQRFIFSCMSRAWKEKKMWHHCLQKNFLSLIFCNMH